MWDPWAEYFQGWGLGDDVVLLRRDANGKVVRDVHRVDWYFYAAAEKCERVKPGLIDRAVKSGVFLKVERGAPYWRFFVSNPQRGLDPAKVFARMDNPDLYDIWARPFIVPEGCPAFRYPDDRGRWTDVHEAMYWLESKGVIPLEADITPLRRFLIDNDVKIQENYRLCFFDFETDDRGSLSEKEQSRILSVAWEGSDGQDGYHVTAEHSDWGEREMLTAFLRDARQYDFLVAWNGTGFDFPMLFARARHVGIRVNWRSWLYADPLPIFRKRFLRQQVGSYSLDSMGQQVLKERKLDWRDEFRRRRPGVQPSIYHLWLMEPDLLEEYNRRDVRILRGLETNTQFLSVERLQNRVAGVFANDVTVSNKIDTMILRKGQRDNVHFRTRLWIPYGSGEQYAGAHVFAPKVGLHENVGVFDFKALYPSMIRSFNISPETYVRPEERERHDPATLCTCPVVEMENGQVRGGTTYTLTREGFVGQMFKDTTERRGKYQQLAKARLAEKGTKDDPQYKLYDNLAYAFKSLGLSFYGEMGHSSGRYYEVEMAESITLSGQFFLRQTQRMASEAGYTVIYGDTDSVFIQLLTASETADMTPEERRVALEQRGIALLDHFQAQYGGLLEACNTNPAWNTVQLEFEDIYDRIAFFAKKRYAGKLISSKGESADGLEVKGLEYMRSDYPLLTRRLQHEVLEAVLRGGAGAEQVLRDIIEPARLACEQGKHAAADLVISKAVTKDPSEYANRPLHVRLADELRAKTSEFYKGIKIRYIVTASKPEIDGCLETDYNPTARPYDAAYYWDKVIYPATLRVAQVLFPERNWDVLLYSHQAKRKVLLARYSRWMTDHRRRAEAVARIKANADNILTVEDLAYLRGVYKETAEEVEAARSKSQARQTNRDTKAKQREAQNHVRPGTDREGAGALRCSEGDQQVA